MILANTPQFILLSWLFLSKCSIMNIILFINVYFSEGIMVEESKVHVKFGLIADVQYADADDGYNFSKTRRRYYRAALDLLKKAVWDWKSQHAELDFVVQLGDIIDGINRRQGGENAANTALELSLEPFKELNCSTFHVIGNHDLYNFTKSYLLRSMLNSSKLPNVLGVDDKLYYVAIVHPHLKVIVLDTYDISVLGYEDQQEHTGYSLALDVLDKNNPNEEKNSVIGLKGYDARFAAYNGGISTQQLMWFDAQLAEADASKQNVIVCSKCLDLRLKLLTLHMLLL